MEQELKIIYRNHGIADRFPDGTIEMNKHLNEWPQLKKSIIQHEIKHTNRTKFNKKDLMHDLTTINQMNNFHLAMFMFRHPLSLTQALPLYYTKKRGWVYDQIAALMWVVTIAFLSGAVYIGFIL